MCSALQDPEVVRVMEQMQDPEVVRVMEQIQSDPSWLAMVQQMQQVEEAGGAGGDGIAARDAAAAGAMPPEGMDPAAYESIVKVSGTHSTQGRGHCVVVDVGTL
jgi:hypothetical protein